MTHPLTHTHLQRPKLNSLSLPSVSPHLPLMISVFVKSTPIRQLHSKCPHSSVTNMKDSSRLSFSSPSPAAFTWPSFPLSSAFTSISQIHLLLPLPAAGKGESIVWLQPVNWSWKGLQGMAQCWPQLSSVRVLSNGEGKSVQRPTRLTSIPRP